MTLDEFLVLCLAFPLIVLDAMLDPDEFRRQFGRPESMPNPAATYGINTPPPGRTADGRWASGRSAGSERPGSL